MNPNHLAILTYGVLCHVLLAVLAVFTGSASALATLVVAVALTYLFQVLLELRNDGDDVWACVCWAAAILFAAMSFLLSLWSFS